MNEQQIKEEEHREQQWINEQALKCGMTERIKTLALQAGMFLDTNDLMPGSTLMLWNHDIQKFAQLIVAECAEIADEHNSEVEGVTLGVGNAIKEHFRIKE